MVNRLKLGGMQGVDFAFNAFHYPSLLKMKCVIMNINNYASRQKLSHCSREPQGESAEMNHTVKLWTIKKSMSLEMLNCSVWLRLNYKSSFTMLQ